jgi:hypothetical protein
VPAGLLLAALGVVLLMVLPSRGPAPSLAPRAGSTLAVLPFPGTAAAAPGSLIALPAVAPAQVASLVVAGSSSGAHRGHLAAQPGGRGTAFLPDRPFSAGERVTVSAALHSAAAARASGVAHGRVLRWSFTVASPPTGPAANPAWPPSAALKPVPVQQFFSAPGLRPPTVQVTVPDADPGAGDVFLDPVNASQNGPMILDGQGRVVWFDPLPGGAAFDLQVQRYQERPVLTWFQGSVVPPGYGVGEEEIVDRSYRTIATVRAGEGYQVDLHDFQITPQGTALFTVFAPVAADLSSVGGSRHGVALDSILQEVDIRSGRVLWEWHALGHVPIAQSRAGTPIPNSPYDWFHANSIDIAPNGDLVISARSTWAVYDIDRHTGAIRWQLGGRGSSFAMGPGTNFEWQHDARVQPDGTVTLFDNASDPQEERASRVLELALDTRTMRATLAHSDTHRPGLLSPSQGNAQRLPDGNTFVGWGQLPNLTEYGPQGAVLLDAALPAPADSYRAFRFPWQGQPASPPSLALQPGPAGALTVYASWNGATAVAHWRVLAGPAAGRLSALATAPKGGFETAIAVHTVEPYVAVQALDAGGRLLASSNVTRRPN